MDSILVINAGSSSIKFAVFGRGNGIEPEEPVLRVKGQIEGLAIEPHFQVKDADGKKLGESREWPHGSSLSHADALRYILGWLKTNLQNAHVVAAGHRVVHGGLLYDAPVQINAAVITDLERLAPLAPLHQPHNLAAIRALAEIAPDLPQIACFDTAFHRTQPRVAQLFALPRALLDSGVRRYGFHGLSYEYIARKLPEYAPDAKRVVVAHLGSGASMCGIREGRSIESTMGFTTVDGLPMGTRTGGMDPGVVLYLMQDRGYDMKAIEKLLYKDSGLLGLSGISNDMRDLLTSTEAHAVETINLFVYHVVKYVGALTAAIGGLDALVFTAGIGENSPVIREKVCATLGWLGIQLDDAANRAGGPCISTVESTTAVWVIPTDEERMIALHVREVLHE